MGVVRSELCAVQVRERIERQNTGLQCVCGTVEGTYWKTKYRPAECVRYSWGNILKDKIQACRVCAVQVREHIERQNTGLQIVCGTGEGTYWKTKYRPADILVLRVLKYVRYDLYYNSLQLQFRQNNNYSYTIVNLYTGVHSKIH